MTDMTMPFNVEAEEAILGSVLIDPRSFPTLDLDAGDFFIERHQWIWQAFVKINTLNQPVDYISLGDKLTEMGKLESVGGQASLFKLINRVPTSLHAEQYAEIIKDKSRRRKIILTARDLTIAAFDPQSDLDSETAQATDNLTKSITTQYDMVHIGDALPDLIDEVNERAANPNATPGIPTGFIDLDRLTLGVDGLWYVAGAPGVGKSILMLCIAVNAAKMGKGVAIFSIEMKTIAQLRRAISADAEIPTRILKTGQIDAEQWEAFYKATEEMADLPIWICDDPMLTTAQFHAHLTRLKSRNQVDLFALDYLYLLTDEPSLNPTQRTEVLSSRIKAIQRATDINGITVNSITKDGTKNADMTNVRGSFQLIHDADVVVFIEPHENFESMRKLSLKKGRDLESLGRIDLVKTNEFPSFRDAVARKVPKRGQYDTGKGDLIP